MMDPELYISQGLKIIKGLISQGNLQAALNACRELLKVNPYHKEVQKYLRKIEEEIVEQNEKKADADIDATMPLWKEQRYDELMKIYAKLYQYAPRNIRLIKLIEKLQERLTQQQKDERDAFLNKAAAAIEGLLKEKHFADTIQACNELLGISPGNSAAEVYLKEAKTALIEQKLKENERIFESADFERALEFYNSLLAIDPENQRIKNLAFQVSERMAEHSLIADRVHLNESIVRMKELFKTGEYEKVLQACEEILRLDPNNLSATIFRKKAAKTLHREINILTLKKLKEIWAAMEPEYLKNPAAYARI